MTMDDLMTEWLETRERIVSQITALNAGCRIHLVGDPCADAAALSLAKLKAWQQEIDELMIAWLMSK
jgi:hypothetical protein